MRLLPILALTSLALSACMQPVEQREGAILYPSDLQPPLASVVVWPADKNGARFRFVMQDSDGWIDDAAPMGETAVPPDWGFDGMLPQRISSIVVLLPLGAGPELRDAARTVLAHVEESRRDVSASLLTTPITLTLIEDVPTLTRVLHQARLRHRTERPGSLADALQMMQFMPRWVILPEEASAERFVAIGNLWDELDEVGEAVYGEEELLAHLDARFATEPWTLPSVALLVPRDADAARCDALAERIAALRPDHGVLLRGTVEDPFIPDVTRGRVLQELQSAQSLDGLLVGPVVVRLAYKGDRTRSPVGAGEEQ